MSLDPKTLVLLSAAVEACGEAGVMIYPDKMTGHNVAASVGVLPGAFGSGETPADALAALLTHLRYPVPEWPSPERVQDWIGANTWQEPDGGKNSEAALLLETLRDFYRRDPALVLALLGGEA